MSFNVVDDKRYGWNGNIQWNASARYVAIVQSQTSIFRGIPAVSLLFRLRLKWNWTRRKSMTFSIVLFATGTAFRVVLFSPFCIRIRMDEKKCFSRYLVTFSSVNHCLNLHWCEMFREVTMKLSEQKWSIEHNLYTTN